MSSKPLKRLISILIGQHGLNIKGHESVEFQKILGGGIIMALVGYVKYIEFSHLDNFGSLKKSKRLKKRGTCLY